MLPMKDHTLKGCVQKLFRKKVLKRNILKIKTQFTLKQSQRYEQIWVKFAYKFA